MKIGTIEFSPRVYACGCGSGRNNFARGAISISTAACSLFNSTPVRQTVVPHAAAKNAEPYQIGRDDELEIIVWNQPQLSGKVIVASDGTIAMPLIGRVPAAGLTPDTLKVDLEKLYGRYVHGANITVRVSDPASHVFYVIGSVNKPGAYKLHSGEVFRKRWPRPGGLGSLRTQARFGFCGTRKTRRSCSRSTTTWYDQVGT